MVIPLSLRSDDMKVYLIGVLTVYVALQAFKGVLEYLNVRQAQSGGPFLPQEFEAVADPASIEKMQAYVKEKTAFEMVGSTAAALAVIIFLFGGLLDRYNSWVASFGFSLLLSGPTFFLLLYAAGAVLWVPFSLFFVFRIENRHGFNTMTGRLWIVDFVKSTALSLILLAMVSFASFALMSWSKSFWWLWVWCFFLAFTVFVTYAAPYVIEPLFNKFVPVEEEDLKARIVSLATGAGINVSRILKMDESKRSRHTNAYFAGIGRTKRIILFDTLLQGMTPDEIIAVLAHEIGHWKRHHLLKGLALSQAVSLAFLFCAYYALKSRVLVTLFAISVDTLPAKILLFAFLASMVLFLLKPAMNGFSRKLEREADRFSCDLGGKSETMVDALVKLSKENLSNLFPHPLYVFFNYSHPPVLDRIRYIRAYCGRSRNARWPKA